MRLQQAIFLVLGCATQLSALPAPQIPRTDGRPDFQGIWSNNTITPFLRPAAIADKEFFTDEEIAVLSERANRLFDGSGDTAPGEDLIDALLANPTVHKTPRRGGDYNYFWAAEPLVFERRTSQVIDLAGEWQMAESPPSVIIRAGALLLPALT